MNISSFFIERPIFATVLAILITVAGLLAMPQLPISEYPEIVPPTVVVSGQYPGASPKTIAETVITPLEQQINGVENAIYTNSTATPDGTRRHLFHHGDVQTRHRPRHCAGADSEPCGAGRDAPAGRRATDWAGHAEALAGSDHGCVLEIRRRPLRFAISAQLRRHSNQGRAGAAARHGRCARLRIRRLRHALVARSRKDSCSQYGRG